MFFDKPETQSRISDTGALGEPTTFAERTIATYEAGLVRDRANSRQFNLADAYDERIKAIRDGLGVEMVSPMNRGGSTGAEMGVVDPTDWHSEFQKELEALAEKHPNKADIIGADKPVGREVQKRYDATTQRETDASRNYGGLPGTGPIADFAGGMAAVARDPVQAPTFLLGPTSPVRQGIRAIIGMGLKQGAVNAGTQAIFEPIIQQYRKDMGDVYGISESALNIGMAGALGFGLDAGARSAARGIQKGLGRVAITDPASGGVVGYESKAKAAARARAAERVKAIEAIAPETIQKAQAGDLPAIKEVLTATGEIDDPSVRGAIQALELHPELKDSPIDDLDYGARERQMMRALTDGAEPFPVDVPPVRQSTSPDLNDFAELPKGIDGNQHYRNFDIDGKPVAFKNLDPKDITTDATAFQFKSGGDGSGVTGKLGAVQTWDPMASGKVVVFERLDGSLVIADGHQRLGLAKSLIDQNPALQGFVFREADGWTTGDVRALAAKKNLQEGSGDILDAAKIIKDRPDIIDDKMPLGTEFMRLSRALARLEDEAFGKVVGGVIEPKHGAMIADLVHDKSQHSSVIDELARLDPKTDREARVAIGEIVRAPLTMEEQTSLFGGSVAPRFLMAERVGVLDGVLGTLRRDQRVFSTLANNADRAEEVGNKLKTKANVRQALEAETIAAVVEKLAQRSGYVSNLLNQAAKSVAEGQPKQRAVDAFLRQIAEKIRSSGIKGLDDDAVVLAALPQTMSMEFNARMARARSMGFDTSRVLYHGTGDEIAAFDLSKAQDKEGRKRGLGLGKGKVYLTGNQWSAGEWAMQAPERGLGSAPNVLPVMVRGRLLDEADYQAKFKELSGGKAIFDSTLEMKERDALIAKVDKWAKSEGYSGVQQVYRDQKTGEIMETGQVAMFKPNDIRSVNAEFADADSPVLLASLSRQQPALLFPKGTYPADGPGFFHYVNRANLKVQNPATIQRIAVADMIPTQSPRDLVDADIDRMVSEGVRDAANPDDAVHVYEYGGKFYIIDGHHRWTAAVERGDADIQARVKRLVPKDDAAILASLRGGDAATGKSMRADLDALGYYSKALEAAKSWPQAKGAPEQALMWLKKSGVKDAEIEATKVGKAFEGQKSITRDDLVKHLTENRVGLNQVVRARDDVSLSINARVDARMQEWLDKQNQEAKFDSGSVRDDERLFDSTSAFEDAVEWLERKGVVFPDDAIDDDPIAAFKQAGVSIDSGRIAVWADHHGWFFLIKEPKSEEVFVLAEAGDFRQTYASKLEAITELEREAKDLLRDNISSEEDNVRYMFREEAEHELDGFDPTKFSNYSLDPSNPTYRETVLHLPSPTREALGRGGPDDTIEQVTERLRAFNEAENSRNATVFRSGHFPEPNITGHMMTSMVKHEGKPVYLIDQIQSDWGQKLRDGGVRDEAKIADLRNRLAAAKDAFAAESKRIAETPNYATDRQYHAAEAELDRLRAELGTAATSAVGHPLANTTDQWTTTTLRRALRQAAEAEAEFIAIPSGKTVLSYNPGDEHGMETFYNSIVPKNLRNILSKLDKESPAPQQIDQLEAPSKGMAGQGFTLFPLTEKVKRSVIEEGQPLFASRPDTIKTAADLEAFSQNLESVLKDAQKPVPPRMMDNVLKEGPKQTAEMMERYQGDVTLAAYRNAERAAAVLERAARMQQFSPGFSIRNIFDRQMKTPGFVGSEPFDLSSVQIKSRAEGDVPVKAVKTIQKTVSLDAVKDKIKNPGSDLPSVFKFGDSYYINDGNHRITAAKAQGLDTIRVEIIEIEVKGSAGAGPADAASKPVGSGPDNPTLAQLVFDQIDAQRAGYADAIEQATRVLDDAYPGAREQIQAALDAAPALRDRLSELVGTDRAQATALLRDAMPAPAKPDMPPQVDISQPLLYTSAANARMAEIRAEIDRTIQMLPPDVRLRVEDQLVWNADGTDVRVDGLWDGYDRIVYVSLAAGDPVRTVRHEVIHALRQSKLMTDAEFSTLYTVAEKLKLRGAYNIDAEYAQKYAAVYGHKGQDYVEMLLREETIANMFSDYSLNGRRFGDIEGGSIIDQIIDRIVQFMKNVRDGLNLFGFREVRDIFEEIESGRMAQRRTKLPDGTEIEGRSLNDILAAIRAYHGSPHDFDSFKLDKIGTGEGAQAYGHGLYFAENEGVAKSYRDALTGPDRFQQNEYRTFRGKALDNKNAEHFLAETLDYAGGDVVSALSRIAVLKGAAQKINGGPAVKKLAAEHIEKYNRAIEMIQAGARPELDPKPIPGHMYEVNIKADPNDFLDWDRPLSQQSEKVKRLLAARDIASRDDLYDIAADNGIIGPDFDPDGAIGPILKGQSMAADSASRAIFEDLKDVGIPGIRYLDQGSRTAGDGTYNYVVFDDNLIEIVARDGKPVSLAEVAARAEPGAASEAPIIQEIRDMSDLAGACKS